MTARAVNEHLPAATCAYERCQAGGVILAGAPRRGLDLGVGDFVDWRWYHRGCWAALEHELHERAKGAA